MQSLQNAIDWFLERGGDAAIAKTKEGGRQYLAQGDVAPFTAKTIKRLIDAGYAEKYAADSGQRLRIFATAHGSR